MKAIGADFVIIGAGSAGCVLANRLSANPECHVLLIEAGGWDRDPFVAMPAGFVHLMRSGRYDWGYHTEPQEQLFDRRLFWPRGRIIGGSSSINGMIYIRGHASDYDYWAQLGNRGWSYADCLPYFTKSEQWSGPPSGVHGHEGPLRTSRQMPEHPVARAFVAAAASARYPWNPDFNSGDQFGFGPCDSTIGAARRSSASAAFLRPALDRRNLTVLTKALATRITFSGDRATGVSIVHTGREIEISAEKEVLLSGGAINSPHLLQLSGVGDPAHLEVAGIKVKHALPGVGENLHDHVVGKVKQGVTGAKMLQSEVAWWRAALSVSRYMLTGAGPAAHHGIQVLGFVNSQSGLAAPDLQYHLLLVMYDDHGRTIATNGGFMPFFNQSRPQSRGYVRARSTDPRQAPAINPRIFSQRHDLEVMRAGLKITREIIAQPPLAPFRDKEWAPGLAVQSDQEIDEYLRRTVESVYHPVGTCKMGSDDMAVVDDRLRVRGLNGLRVIDASIMPSITSGNTNAPTLMIAERAADFLLQ